tara:strand:- start:382 stop:558 length:177 start_codon:yes stop_codon:yes gene_type:complete
MEARRNDQEERLEGNYRKQWKEGKGKEGRRSMEGGRRKGRKAEEEERKGKERSSVLRV